ncbi:hypothetical protein CTAYLR_005068 [Chrysophaeum taylorii]|uniref:phosphoethanolamine N-methyltransferase n=1 Tax=Chrysophaeum taylorii TaxID=2483200 RepID=A0AAD7XJR6_9STRA|nr:hypothetical protein CTAYLR_005068 [Chrysophaeum taylorii]
MKAVFVATVFAAAALGEEACEDGVVEATAIGDEKNQKDYYERASHYDKIWGSDNLHLGFYPHLAIGGKKTKVELTHMQAAHALTERMIDLAGIKNGSRILDLGAGKGLACYEIGEATGASCLGIDLAEANVRRGNEIASANPHLNLKFEVGSFTSLPDSVVAGAPYDVVFAQVSFCHVHSQLDKIFAQVKRALGDDSIFIVNDYLGGNGEPSEETKAHVYKRLHFEMLHGPKAWRQIADDAGLTLLYYETLDDHMHQTYRGMAQRAKYFGLFSKDGAPLHVNYEQTAEAIKRAEIGMNLAVFKLL